MTIVLVQGIKYRLMPRISEPVAPWDCSILGRF